MRKTRPLLIFTGVVLLTFMAGRWSRFDGTVKADSGDNPQVEVREISGASSLVVYYPNLKKMFVYQNPFVGLPTWPCAYSIQLSSPGGSVNRQPCNGQ